MVVVHKGAMLSILRADQNTLPARSLGLIRILILGRAVRRIVTVSTARPAAVEPDTVATTGDAVAFARAAGASGAHAGRRRAVGGARRKRGHIRVVVRIVLGDGGSRRSGGDGLAREAAGQRLEGSLIVLGIDDLAGLVRALWAGRNDAGGRERAALGDRGGADAARVAA